jgi:hypothetical protein
MFFSSENAIADFERKVKELWNIPRKMYYLLINGKYESHVSVDWPNCAMVCVKLKGLLGGLPAKSCCDSGKDPAREAFPMGLIRLGIAGRILKARNSKSIDDIGLQFDFRTAFHYWLSDGRKISSEEKLFHVFPPDPQQIYYVDEAIWGETEQDLLELGPVNLKLGESIYTVRNNQTFEEAFRLKNIVPESESILLPDGTRVLIKDARIRQYLGSGTEEVTEICWAKDDSSRELQPENDPLESPDESAEEDKITSLADRFVEDRSLLMSEPTESNLVTEVDPPKESEARSPQLPRETSVSEQQTSTTGSRLGNFTRETRWCSTTRRALWSVTTIPER